MNPNFYVEGQHTDGLQVQDGTTMTLTPMAYSPTVSVTFPQINAGFVAAFLVFAFGMMLFSNGLKMPSATKAERSRRIDAVIPAIFLCAVSAIIATIAWGRP